MRAWMRLLPHNQTYAALKLRFTAAYTELRAADAKVDTLEYHSVSAVVAQILEKLRMAGVQDPQDPPEEPESLTL